MKIKTTHRRRRLVPRASRAPHHKPAKQDSFRVVGIGASAGGLEAFTQILRPLPIDTGMAFVLIQHLDPGHPSMLSEILGRETRMPVHEVRDNTIVEPNQVYVIPPNAKMILRGGLLHLLPRVGSADVHIRPIDDFLRSLAADKGSRAIAVILSGADTDGSEALEAIKAKGGMVIAQDPTLARYNAMPAAAVETGFVDFILPAELIARELARMALNRRAPQIPLVPGEEGLPRGESELETIYSILRRHHGVDFSHYKQTTLKRRIQRRMLVQKARTLKEYLELLKTHPAEVGTLYDDLLIHVTEFFRDPGVFENLKKKVFPRLFKNRSAKDAIRIWVPGCSTGEEVYSVIICLMEYLGDRGAQTPIQVFATDISEGVLQKARLGIYRAESLKHVSIKRRQRFFTPIPGAFQINKSIRSLCVFSKQNVAKDPPFSRLDLICCRNVLIYLDEAMQNKVLSIFNYALKPSGLLLLGKSESLGVFPDLFNPLDRPMKVYTKAATMVLPPTLLGALDSPVDTLIRKPPQNLGDSKNLNMQKEADQFILQKRAPAGVIVDAAMNIVQFRGDIGQYLELAPGAASFHLFKLAKEGLLLELRPALLQARKQKGPVIRTGSRVSHDGHFKNVTIEVVPLQQSPAHEPHFLVLFQETLPDAPPASKPGRSVRGRAHNAVQKDGVLEGTRLKRELAATKDYLQSVINEHERINEELKSANEEALSSNEEFQSTNEELETAKEELQATNEETTTLNEDLHNRNIELNRLNNDLVNLMNSVNIPTVILGKDHYIRRLTTATEKVLNMSRADVGRSIHDLKLTMSPVDLKSLIDTVQDTLEIQQRELQDMRGHWYLMRIQPYKTLDDAIDGVVLTFSDIQIAKDHQATAAAWTADLEKRVKERTEELAKSQSALLQSEKLEAVGRLAGGVAHDFNNLMTGILGMTEDVKEGLGAASPYQGDLDEVINAAKKAMVVTKQLLSFGRRRVFDPRVLNMNRVIGDMKKLLQRLLGEDIDLKTHLDAHLGNVHIDHSSIEQVILNLALNARDAMPKGGKIQLQTQNTEVRGVISKFSVHGTKQNLEIPSGPYVTLTVTDEGDGIRPEDLSHIFEPFFTTKAEGKGTGLGLATVYGIVKQSGGGISVHSTPGKGTTFTIYLPRLGAVSGGERTSLPSRENSGGIETILVTEDEDIVRTVVIRALQKKGYTVLHASHGSEALKISEEYVGPIHLLLTDVIMPGMNGRELATSLSLKRPDLAILYMSGHDRDIIAQRGVLEAGMAFIEKSFTAEDLCHKVREVLDEASMTKGRL